LFVGYGWGDQEESGEKQLRWEMHLERKLGCNDVAVPESRSSKGDVE